MRCLSRVGVGSPPRVVDVLSVGSIKPRLILSMRTVVGFCRDAPFSLTPLSDVVGNIPVGGFFLSAVDVQGFKHLSLTVASRTYCAFEWGNWWFCDTTIPFGRRSSAYVYTTTGNVLTGWLNCG